MMLNVPGSADREVFGRRSLDQPGGKVPRLREQEEADLRHVRSRGDVDEVVLGLRIESVGAGEAMQGLEHFLEVPRIRHFDEMGPHLGLR